MSSIAQPAGGEDTQADDRQRIGDELGAQPENAGRVQRLDQRVDAGKRRRDLPERQKEAPHPFGGALGMRPHPGAQADHPSTPAGQQHEREHRQKQRQRQILPQRGTLRLGAP
jgi:hypothetical protein